ASLMANVVRGVRGVPLALAIAVDSLAFADAYLLARGFTAAPVLASSVFVVGFVGLRSGLRLLSTRVGLPAVTDPRAEQPGLLVPLALAPLGALPLITAAQVGDGGLLLTLAAVLALLVPVR